MDKWDKKEKGRKETKLDRWQLKLSLFVLRYYPKFLLSLEKKRVDWVLKHGIKISPKNYLLLNLSFFMYVLFGSSYTDQIILTGKNGLLPYAENIHQIGQGEPIEISLTFPILIIIFIVTFLLAAFGDKGNGRGRRKGNPDNKDEGRSEIPKIDFGK